MADPVQENKNAWVLPLIALVVGAFATQLIVTGQTQDRTTASNQQDLIDALPAVVAQLEVLSSELQALKSDTLSGGEIDSRIANNATEVDSLGRVVERRFGEDVADEDKILRDDIEKNENTAFDMVQRIAALEALVATQARTIERLQDKVDSP